MDFYANLTLWDRNFGHKLRPRDLKSRHNNFFICAVAFKNRVYSIVKVCVRLEAKHRTGNMKDVNLRY